MKLIKKELNGVFIVENFFTDDNRGSFTKTLHQDIFEENGLCVDYKESYFSVSGKDVIRGMHFQKPPYDGEKLVYVTRGSVVDVVLDLRKGSKTFGKHISVELSADNHRSIYIPKGLAHGFKSLEDNTTLVYNVSAVYNRECDCGIHYNSFGCDWELDSPIMSDRDCTFGTFEDFKTNNPF